MLYLKTDIKMQIKRINLLYNNKTNREREREKVYWNVNVIYYYKYYIRKSPKPEKAGKKPRIWELGGTTKDLATLERTKDKPEESGNYVAADTTVIFFLFLLLIFAIMNHKKYNYT